MTMSLTVNCCITLHNSGVEASNGTEKRKLLLETEVDDVGHKTCRISILTDAKNKTVQGHGKLQKYGPLNLYQDEENPLTYYMVGPFIYRDGPNWSYAEERPLQFKLEFNTANHFFRSFMDCAAAQNYMNTLLEMAQLAKLDAALLDKIRTLLLTQSDDGSFPMSDGLAESMGTTLATLETGNKYCPDPDVFSTAVAVSYLDSKELDGLDWITTKAKEWVQAKFEKNLADMDVVIGRTKMFVVEHTT